MDVTYVIIANNRSVPAVEAARTMDAFTTERMSIMIGYPVSYLNSFTLFICLIFRGLTKKGLTEK